MTTKALRTKVHQYIDEANNDILEVIAQLLEVYRQNNHSSVLTKAQQEEVLQRSELYKQGKTKVYTLNEAKEKFKKASH